MPGATRSWKREGRILPRAFRGSTTILIPDFQISSLQTVRKLTSIVLSYLVCDVYCNNHRILTQVATKEGTKTCDPWRDNRNHWSCCCLNKKMRATERGYMPLTSINRANVLHLYRAAVWQFPQVTAGEQDMGSSSWKEDGNLSMENRRQGAELA